MSDSIVPVSWIELTVGVVTTLSAIFGGGGWLHVQISSMRAEHKEDLERMKEEIDAVREEQREDQKQLWEQFSLLRATVSSLPTRNEIREDQKASEVRISDTIAAHFKSIHSRRTVS